MRRAVLLSLLLAGLAVAARASDPPADAKLIQGKWIGVSIELEGQKPPAGQPQDEGWTFMGNEVRFDSRRNEGAPVKGTFTIDPGKTPKELDLIGESNGRKVVLRGIYRLEKDRLTICLRTPLKEEQGRPKEFATSEGSGLALLVFERAKQ